MRSTCRSSGERRTHDQPPARADVQVLRRKRRREAALLATRSSMTFSGATLGHTVRGAGRSCLRGGLLARACAARGGASALGVRVAVPAPASARVRGPAQAARVRTIGRRPACARWDDGRGLAAGWAPARRARPWVWGGVASVASVASAGRSRNVSRATGSRARTISVTVGVVMLANWRSVTVCSTLLGVTTAAKGAAQPLGVWLTGPWSARFGRRRAGPPRGGRRQERARHDHGQRRRRPAAKIWPASSPCLRPRCRTPRTPPADVGISAEDAASGSGHRSSRGARFGVIRRRQKGGAAEASPSSLAPSARCAAEAVRFTGLRSS